MKKKISIGLAIIAFIGFSAGAYEYRREHQKSVERDQTNVLHKEFADWCLGKFPAKTASEKIINLRHCVTISSEFSTDKKNKEIWNDHLTMAQWLLDYAHGKSEKAPPMECAYRSGSFRGVLESVGFEAKNLVVALDVDNFDDHVVVEVLNPDTGQWQMEDPTYDAHYTLKGDKTKRALSMQELLVTDKDRIQACDYTGRCGWDYETREGKPMNKTRDYWNLAYSKEDKALYVASKRFDETKKRPVYGELLSYCEWRKKWCGNVVHLQ